MSWPPFRAERERTAQRIRNCEEGRILYGSDHSCDLCKAVAEAGK